MFCTGCGFRLGSGRFCTNCGHPIPSESASGETVERPEVPVPAGPPPSGPPPSGPPPPAFEPPAPPRYPLFSDELYVTPAAEPSPPAPSTTRSPGSSWLPWTLTVVVLILIALIGGMLLVSDGDEEQPDDQARANAVPKDEAPPSSKSPGPTPTETPPPADGPQELARFAAASAPKTAKPNLDTKGNLVRYEARNMLDGVAQTCWRMPGDGTGQEITFTLSGPTELSEVGLINGYAKSAGKLDWYAGNRRVLEVEWLFDNGTSVDQTLTETRDLQSMPITPVTTSSVVLRLVSVSDPGRGPSARNYTAISDISLVGEPV